MKKTELSKTDVKNYRNFQPPISINGIRFTMLILCLCWGTISHAVIPDQITGTYTVNTSDATLGECVVKAGATLIITNNATATFNGNLTIEESAKVVVTNATIKMKPASKILIKGFSAYTGLYGTGGSFEATNALITTATPNQFWKGIEAERGNIEILPIVKMASKLKLTNCTVSWANNAVTNFNTNMNIIAMMAGGSIEATDVSFVDNKRSIWIYFADSVSNGINRNLKFTRCDFSLNDDFPHIVDHFVNLHTVTYVPFRNCTFTGQKNLASPFENTSGIVGTKAGILIEPDATGNPGSTFLNLKYGIYLANQLMVNKPAVIKEGEFICRYAMYLDGCFKPSLIANRTSGNSLNHDFVDFFLNNSTGYTIQRNDIAHDVTTSTYPRVGIVIMNSGTAYNQVYRNSFNTSDIDIQAIGTNKSINGKNGLKILCNNLYLVDPLSPRDDHNIMVMKDIVYNSNNGIHNSQFEAGAFLYLDRSAANQFPQYVDPTNAPRQYYLESGTNNLSSFIYKYSSTIPNEKPIYTNIPSTNLKVASTNLCPISIVTPPINPFSFLDYTNKIQMIENGISTIEAKIDTSEKDASLLSYLYSQHALLIDSIVDYHLSKNNVDSIALAYEQVTKGYHYQLYLAFTYRSLGRHEDAINVFNNILAGFELSEEEKKQIANLATIYVTLKWLDEHNQDWEKMPEHLKVPIYEFEQGDRMFAGSIARSLLVEHEGKIYPPVYRLPEQEVIPMSGSLLVKNENKIYPNPAHDLLFVDWASIEGSELILVDIMGREVVRETLKNTNTPININHLMSGIYLAQIKSKGRILYQQKVVKQ